MAKITLAEAAEALLRRREARDSLVEFSKYIVPEEPPALHHRYLCYALDDVARAMSGDAKVDVPEGEWRRDRLMIFMPPGSAKSSYSSVRFPAYFLGRYPNMAIICASYGEKLATDFGRKVRNIVKSKEYGLLFDTRLSEDAQAKGEWGTNHGGSYFAAGVGSGVTGRRANLGLIDDPVKGQKEADSLTTRDDAWNWYKSDFFSRLKPNAAQIIIQCMTGDTSVTMGDGSRKWLKDIKIGDSVATYDNGEITTSTVLNWRNQGSDCVLKISMKSGIIVRANERHPFLVERKGVPEWVRLRDLNVGESVLRVIGVNGRESSANKKVAKNPQSAKDTAARTTVEYVGRKGTEPRQLIQKPKEVDTSSTDTGSPSKSTIGCLRARAENALYAINCLQKTIRGAIGKTSYASTIATTQEKCGGFSAMIATLRSGMEKLKKCCSAPQNTFEIALDSVVEISPDGYEDVFDIQVDRTENFIANGLISHNTRWNDDDLSGRILPDDWNGESGDFIGFDGQIWRVICLPAEARDEDILGRAQGEWLWPDYYTPEIWENIKKVQTSDGHEFRVWNALYQQTPQPDSGVFFKREWFKRFDLGDEPPISMYGASDYAVSDGKGDATEHGAAGFDAELNLWVTNWWSGRTTADVWIEHQLDMIEALQKDNKGPYAWMAEVGVIRRAVEPFLTKRKRERRVFFRQEWMPHIGDKGANARAFQALAASGQVYIPRCEWGDALIDQCVKFIPGTDFEDDKVDVMGLFGRAVDSSFGPREQQIVPVAKRDSYGDDEDESEDTWITA